MSDEMNRITEQTAQQDLEQMAAQSEQDALSEEIRRRLAEPGSGKPTLEEFKLMVYKDRERRRKKRNTMVACIVAAFIVGFFSFEYLVPEVGADKNPKETIQTEDGVIIEDGGWGSSTGEDDVWVTEDWDSIKYAKQHYPSLLTPEYVPQKYIFDKLTIEVIVEEDIICEYIFSYNDQQLKIEMLFIDGGEESLKMNNSSRTLETANGEVYIFDEENKVAIMQYDDGSMICLTGNISDGEIVRIIESLTS